MPNTISYSTFNKLLIIDDDEFTRVYVARVLERHGYKVKSVGSGQDALDTLETYTPDLILLDVVMPGMDGFETFDRIRANTAHHQTPIIFVTAVDDIKTIYQVFDHGETDYVGKPVRENELLVRIRLHLELRRQANDNNERLREILSLREHLLTGKLNKPDAFASLVTRDQGMFSTFQYIESIAVTSWPVLITGETGTGKELVAKAIHDLSGRKERFVPVNVAGLDDNMFADTLFGHAKGAFTGADVERPGLIERASKGTLFLDEIGDLEPSSQVKLLRLLQEREYYPIGSDIRKVTDARIVVATNRPVDQLVKDPNFRQDLYFRLRTHHVDVPPLRNRRGDVPLLLDHFIKEAAHQLDRQPPECPSTIIDFLNGYDFPGNVRELESMVIDAVSRTPDDTLDIEIFRRAIGDVQPIRHTDDTHHAPPQADVATALQSVNQDQFPTLRQINDLLIDKAMERADGNQTNAAKLLGISRQALNKRLRRADDDTPQ